MIGDARLQGLTACSVALIEAFFAELARVLRTHTTTKLKRGHAIQPSLVHLGSHQDSIA